MLEQIISNINEAITLIRNEEMLAFIVVGKSIMGIGAIIFLLRKRAAAVDYGDGVLKLSDFGPVLFVALALSAYKPLIIGMDRIFESFATASSPSVKDMNAFIASIDKAEKSMDEAQLEAERRQGTNNTQLIKEANEFAENAAQTDDRTWMRTQYEKVKQSINEVGNKITGMFDKFSLRSLLFMALQYLLIFAGKVSFVAIFILSAIFRTVFAIVGPFMIGLSLLPSFENYASNFFQKYLSFCFWLPIHAMIVNLGVKVGSMAYVITDQAKSENFFLDTSGQTVNTFSTSTVVGLLIIIIGTCFVPKITSKLFAVSGSSGATMSNAARAISTMVTKGIA